MSFRRRNRPLHPIDDDFSESSSTGIGVAAITFSVFTFLVALTALVLGIYSAAVLPNKINDQKDCTSDSDCSDGNPCTIDICLADGSCDNAVIPECNHFAIAENTLYVSPEWIPSISNGTFYFTTINAALTQAATYTNRHSNNPVTIFIYPGTYNENITLIPDVVLSGTVPQYATPNPITQISGSTMQYIDNTTGFLSITFANLVIDNDIVISFANRNTAAGTTSVNFYDCKIAGTMTYTARTMIISLIDLLYLHSTDSNDIVLTGEGVVFLDDYTFDGNTFIANNTINIEMTDCTFDSATITQDRSGLIEAFGGSFSNVVFTLSNTAIFTSESYFTSCSFTVNSGTTVDVRGAQLSSVTFTGSGTVARSLFIDQNVASSAGINTVNLSPPYPNTNFNVLWSQVGGVNNQDIKLTSKTASSFQWNDTVGGNHFDFTVIMP